MSKSVMILCLNGRRRTLKFASNATISQILEDVCVKEKIDPMAFDLKTSKAVLDRTLSWNQTNLPNNAKLELCARSAEDQLMPAIVKIALQLPNGERLTGEFSTADFLSEVINRFLSQLKSLLQPSHEDVPEIIYMRQKFRGSKLLSCTRLQQLGILKGSALLRFSFQPPSPGSEDTDTRDLGESSSNINPPPSTPNVMAVSTNKNEISSTISTRVAAAQQPSGSSPCSTNTSALEIKVTSAKVSPNSTKGSKGKSNSPKRSKKIFTSSPESKPLTENSMDQSHQPNSKANDVKKPAAVSPENLRARSLVNFKFPKETKGTSMYRRSSSPSSQNNAIESCPRKAMLFNEANRDRSENAQSTAETDDFFEITVDDLRKMMSDLTHERKKLEEQEMLTEEQRKQKRLQLAHKYPYIVIRIVLPDRLILQGLFRPLEKVKKLYDFVQQHLEIKSFYLFTTPPKQLLKNKEVSLFDSNLAPAARVYFGTDELFANSNQLVSKSSAVFCTVEDANKEIISLKNETEIATESKS